MTVKKPLIFLSASQAWVLSFRVARCTEPGSWRQVQVQVQMEVQVQVQGVHLETLSRF